MTVMEKKSKKTLALTEWITLGLVAGVLAAAAVVAAMALALAIWPDAASFRPLQSYPRAAVFAFVPALVATALFAWLAARRGRTVPAFLRIAVVVLLLSFIPDFILPVPSRTLLTSAISSFLHVIAAIVIVYVLVTTYRRRAEV